MAVFSDLLRGGPAPERNQVSVTFGENEVVLYASPLTGHEIDRIAARHANFATAPTVKAMVDIIIMKAQTEAGDMAFDIGDKAPLMLKPVSLLNEIYVGLFPTKQVDLSETAIEETEKN